MRERDKAVFPGGDRKLTNDEVWELIYSGEVPKTRVEGLTKFEYTVIHLAQGISSGDQGFLIRDALDTADALWDLLEEMSNE